MTISFERHFPDFLPTIVRFYKELRSDGGIISLGVPSGEQLAFSFSGEVRGAVERVFPLLSFTGGTEEPRDFLIGLRRQLTEKQISVRLHGEWRPNQETLAVLDSPSPNSPKDWDSILVRYFVPSIDG